MIRARVNPSVRFRVIRRKLEDCVGLADTEDCTITIDPRQSKREYLSTLCHEWLHLAIPSASERNIIKLEKSLAKLIWNNGYRKIDKNKI